MPPEILASMADCLCNWLHVAAGAGQKANNNPTAMTGGALQAEPGPSPVSSLSCGMADLAPGSAEKKAPEVEDKKQEGEVDGQAKRIDS